MDILSLNKQPQEYSLIKPANSALSPKDFDLHDENFADVLKTLQTEAALKIHENMFIEAIADLMHCEEILESVAAKGELNDIDEVLVLLNNLAMCYQRIGEVDKAIAYLEGVLYNFRFFMNRPSLKNDIKMNALLSKMNLQCCAMFSQKGQHKEALKYAKSAETLIENSLSCLIKAHSRYLKQRNDKKSAIKGKKLTSKSNHSALKILEDYLCSGRLQLKKKLKSPEWSKQIAIADIMLIQLATLSQFKDDFSLSEELALDSLVFKVILLSVAHYCIATETNYIKLSNAFIEVTENSIENEYQESIALLTCFTSSGSKILNHVNEGYFKNCVKNSLDREVKNSRVRKTCVTPVPGESKTILNQRKVSGSIDRRQPRRAKLSCVDFDL